ncbi:MAG: YqgE/AlgH family protein [Gammaproteobacteria bacterium]|nr:YqgE/AlgH family protein [Gammaproteobacteria bacterium]
MSVKRNRLGQLCGRAGRAVLMVAFLQLPTLPPVVAQGEAGTIEPASGCEQRRPQPNQMHSASETILFAGVPAYTQNPTRKQTLAKGIFLVASRTLVDPNFGKSVVLLTEYGELGSMGVVINRPTSVPLSVAFPEFKTLANRPDRIFLGGPVQVESVRLLIRADEAPEDVKHIFGSVYLIDSMDALTRLYSADLPDDGLHVYAGYAGWAPGQLEMEVLRGDWHIAQADDETLFDKAPNSIWPDLIQFVSGLWVIQERIELPYSSDHYSRAPLILTSLAR